MPGLVDHDDTVTSCRSSLSAILEISPALLLATRHCFILPDPPNELKVPSFSVSPVGTGDMHQNSDDASPNANDTDKDSSKKVQDAMIIEKQNAASTSQNEPQELSYTKGSSVDVPQADAESCRTNDSDNPISLVEDSVVSDTRDGRNIILQSAAPNDTNRNEPSCIFSQEASAANTEDTEGRSSNENMADDDSIRRLQRAACTGISAAAVKAKLLADQEERHIWQLAGLVIQKQFQKIEAKMSLKLNTWACEEKN